MLNKELTAEELLTEIKRLNDELNKSKFRANKYKADTRMYEGKVKRLNDKITEMQKLSGTDVHSQNIELLARIHMLEHNIRRYKSTLDDTRTFDSTINDGNIRTFINMIKGRLNENG